MLLPRLLEACHTAALMASTRSMELCAGTRGPPEGLTRVGMSQLLTTALEADCALSAGGKGLREVSCDGNASLCGCEDYFSCCCPVMAWIAVG